MADASSSYLEVSGGVVQTAGGSADLTSGDDPDPMAWWRETDHAGTVRQRIDDSATRVVLADGEEVLVGAADLWLAVDDAFGGPVLLGGCGPRQRRRDTGRQNQSRTPTSPTAGPSAVDQATGEQLWDNSGSITPTLATPFSGSPVLATADTIVLAADGHVDGVVPATGEVRWSIPVPDVVRGITVVDDVLFAWTSTTVLRLD